MESKRQSSNLDEPTIWIVENGKLIKYHRAGSCKECGECCRRVINLKWDAAREMIKDDDREDESDWSGYEGWSFIRQYGVWWRFKVIGIGKQSICSQLENNHCRIWHSQTKHPLCHFWPVHPDNLIPFPDCGYTFVKVE